jgi:hypothetical protein
MGTKSVRPGRRGVKRDAGSIGQAPQRTRRAKSASVKSVNI